MKSGNIKALRELGLAIPKGQTLRDQECISNRFTFGMDHNPLIPTEAQRLLFTVLTTAIPDIIEKFERGQVEHGGNLLDRDLSIDIYDEAKDQLVYAICEKIKRANDKNYE